MLDQPIVARLVIIGRDHEQRVRPLGFGAARQRDGFCRVVAARSRDHRHAPRRPFHREGDDLLALRIGKRAWLACGTQHDERVGSAANLPID